MAMNSDRTQAYGRVVKTLDDLGPAKLLDSEQERVRDAADTLIFAASTDEAARGARRHRDPRRPPGRLRPLVGGARAASSLRDVIGLRADRAGRLSRAAAPRSALRRTAASAAPAARGHRVAVREQQHVERQLVAAAGGRPRAVRP